MGTTTGRLDSQTSFLEVLDGEGIFSPAGRGETTASLSDGFRIRASGNAPVEVPLSCQLLITSSGYIDTIFIPIIVGDSMNLPLGPDAYGYRIYDWTDSCYQEIPAYEWLELRGVGEILTIGDDETRWLEFPADFGFWRYYGGSYRWMSVCANGWVAADTTSRCDFVNVELPYTGAPPNIVAFLWDDLAPSRSGNIFYYYDRQGHRFIVEFDSIPYFGLTNKWERVQVQVFDSTIAGSDQDNPITIQFQTVNDFRSVTVGLQNRDGSSGLTYLWNGNYPRTAAPLIPERALSIIRAEPTGWEEGFSRKLLDTQITAFPNPFREKTIVQINPACNTAGEVGVYQPDGRLVRKIYAGQSPGKSYLWDGRDEKGKKVAPGIYFIKLKNDNSRHKFTKVVLSP